MDFSNDFPPLAKDLISKILVKNPKSRLGLHEIKTHPWIKFNTQTKVYKQEKDFKKLIEEVTCGQSMAETENFAKFDPLIGNMTGFTEDEIIRYTRPDSVFIICFKL